MYYINQEQKKNFITYAELAILMIRNKMADRRLDGLIISDEIMQEIFKEIMDELLARPIKNE